MKNVAIMNKRDCLFEWCRLEFGYADPNANELGLIRAITSNYTLEAEIGNALNCWRRMVVALGTPTDAGNMNELACLRYIYQLPGGYAGTQNVSELNVLDCLRGIVTILTP